MRIKKLKYRKSVISTFQHRMCSGERSALFTERGAEFTVKLFKKNYDGK